MINFFKEILFKNKKKQKIFFVLMSLLFYCSIFNNLFFRNNLSIIIAIIICTILLFFLSPNLVISFMFLTLPCASVIKIYDLSFSLYYIFFVPFIVKTIIAFKNIEITKITHFILAFILLFFSYCFVISIFNNDIDLLIFIKCFLFGSIIFVFCILLLNDIDFLNDVSFIIKSSLLGIIFSSLLFIPSYFSQTFFNNFIDLINAKIRIINGFRRFTGFFADPNLFAFYILSIVIIEFIFSYKNNRKNISNKILSFICFLIGFFSISYSYVVCSFIFAISVFYIELISILKNKKNHLAKKYYLNFLISLLYLTCFGFSIIFLFSYFIAKGNAFSADEIFGNRLMIWQEYIKYFISNPLMTIFGNGINANRSLFSSYFAHNIIFDFVYDFGVIGLAMVVTFLLFSLKYITKKINNKRIFRFCLIISLPIFIMAMTTNLYLSIYLFYIIPLLFLSICQCCSLNKYFLKGV